ncbi:hypothetical protein ACE6H2_010934 [Prunus campanulata]
MPLVTVDISIGSPEPFHITGGMKIKAQKLRLLSHHPYGYIKCTCAHTSSLKLLDV